MRDRKNVESEGIEETKEIRPPNNMSKACKITETQGVYNGLAQISTMSSVYMSWFQFTAFMEFQNFNVSEQGFEFCAFTWALSPLFVCVAQL